MLASPPSSPSAASEVATRAALVAEHYIGTRETAYNRGPVVDSIIRRGGGVVGQSWCMYFVYWCYDRAATQLSIRNPLRRTGACWAQLSAAGLPGSNLIVMLPMMPGGAAVLPGDIPIHARTKRGAATPKAGRQFAGHTGVVATAAGQRRAGYRVLASGTYVAVEGNTSSGLAGSQHDGDGVYMRMRNVRSHTLPVVAFLRVRR